MLAAFVSLSESVAGGEASVVAPRAVPAVEFKPPIEFESGSECDDRVVASGILGAVQPFGAPVSGVQPVARVRPFDVAASERVADASVVRSVGAAERVADVSGVRSVAAGGRGVAVAGVSVLDVGVSVPAFVPMAPTVVYAPVVAPPEGSVSVWFVPPGAAWPGFLTAPPGESAGGERED
ncbi:hypothetical protein ABT369_23375 [Dactylosporangium sp. NPDC000244]|uniref:hypothetical protein n=1 Tax=Dactylosporangium sp. NPDC000244 TaxID=3154365 RepID=UPI0033196647